MTTLIIPSETANENQFPFVTSDGITYTVTLRGSVYISSPTRKNTDRFCQFSPRFLDFDHAQYRNLFVDLDAVRRDMDPGFGILLLPQESKLLYALPEALEAREP